MFTVLISDADHAADHSCCHLWPLSFMNRHENPSPLGDNRHFETKIGDLRESCRFDEKLFLGGGGVVFIFSELRTGGRVRRER